MKFLTLQFIFAHVGSVVEIFLLVAVRTRAGLSLFASLPRVLIIMATKLTRVMLTAIARVCWSMVSLCSYCSIYVFILVQDILYLDKVTLSFVHNLL